MRNFPLVLVTTLLLAACDGDCVIASTDTAGGRERCNRVPPADASQAFSEGFWAFMLGPYPPVPPVSRCPTPDSDAPECKDWWEGAGEGALAAALCESGDPG